MNLPAVTALAEDQWQDIGADSSLGMDQSSFWFKFTIAPVNSSQKQRPRILEIDYPLLDYLELWFVDQQSGTPIILEYYTLGDIQPFENRPIEHPLFLVPVVESENEITLYARVKTSGTVRYPASIWYQDEYLAYTANHNSILALFFGFMAAMAISNLFFFITTRSASFLVYTGYVVCLGITLATLHGHAYQYLWPNFPWLQGRAIAIFASTTLVFAIVFSYQTLNIRAYSERIARYFRVIAFLFGIFTVCCFFVPYAIVIKIFMLVLILAVGSILICGAWLSLKGNPVAKYYTLAWSFLLLSGFSATLDNLDIVSLPISSHYLLIFGASVETLLLGLILAMSYSQQRDSLSAAQQEALIQEQAAARAKDELIKVQQQSQEELEYNVQERTLELEIALRELSEANQELEQLSAIDPLTQIHNRRHFDKRLLAESRRSRREQTALCIAMLDIDHFKQVNDQYGHVGGDKCLQVISRLMKSMLKRPTDEVCRYGGEEFAFILPNTSLPGAFQLLDDVRSAVEETTIISDEHSFSVTLSIGVSCSIIAYEGNEKEVLEHADKLLYQAKQAGRNQVISQDFPGRQRAVDES
jgi:diguanylate cyclase (GGDEF)-like protein